MIPLSLSISGFLSYLDPVELDFTSFDLACISGPNGAGKSSLLDAITWVLFGQARKRDESLVNSHPSVRAAEVNLIFAYEGNIYHVQRVLPRGRTSVLEFHILQDEKPPGIDDKQITTEERVQAFINSPPVSRHWKPLTERIMRETQARIENTLRMDYETFINASFFLQGKADSFTQQRPGDRKRILGSILGLEIWEAYRQRAYDQRKAVETEITSVEARISEIDAELTEEPERREHLDELQARLEILSRQRVQQENVLENYRKIAATLAEQRKLINALYRQVETTRRTLENMQNRRESLSLEQQAYTQVVARATEIEASYTAWKVARQELERWEGIAVQFREQEKQRQEPLNEINTCHASLLQEQQTLEALHSNLLTQRADIPSLEEGAASARCNLASAEARLAQRLLLESQLVEARRQQAEARTENPRLKKEMEELKARIDQLTVTESPACPLCGQPLNQVDRLALIEELTTLGKALGDQFRANVALVDGTDQQVKELESQINLDSGVEKDRLLATESLTRHSERLDQMAKAWQEWESIGQSRLEDIRIELVQASFCPEARQLLAVIDEELKNIGYDAASHDAVRQKEALLRTSETDYLSLERAKAALAPLEGEITNLNYQISALESDLTRQQHEHDEAAASLAVAETQAPDLESAERELFNVHEQENRLRMEVGAAQQKVDVLGDLKLRRKTLETQREDSANLVIQYKQLERAFGKDGVPALLIEQALPQIEARANETLDRLTGGEMTVQFVTQARFKDNRREDLRETLDIRIGDSAGVRDYEMFSGGEAFRVNFAIRLALSEVLSQRAGARLQILVIDEGFGSQDTQGRQRLIEAINLVRADFAKILVISHIDELKDAFPTRIEVEKTERGSVVKVV